MNNFRRVAKNTLLLSTSEVFLKVIGVIWVIFLANSLSVSDYGTYNFVNSFIAIFAFLPDLGVGLIVIREIAKHKEKASSYLSNVLTLNAILSLITILAILAVSIFTKTSSQTVYLVGIASLTLFFSNIRSVVIFYFDGTERMGYSALLNSFNTLLLILFGALGYIFTHDISWIFWGMLVGTVLSLLVTYSRVLKYFRPKLSFNFSVIKHFIIEGFPLGLAAVSYMIYTRVDTVILGNLLGVQKVGIYNAATPFVFSSIQLLNVPFAVAVYPALSRVYAEDTFRFKKAVLKSLLFVAGWSIPFAVIVSILSPYLIPLLFGARYNEAVPVLQTLIFFVPFASLSAILYKVLIVAQKQYLYLFASIMGALVNIVLNLYLIPQYSLFGAAYASISTQVILFIFYIIVVLQLLRSLK